MSTLPAGVVAEYCTPLPLAIGVPANAAPASGTTPAGVAIWYETSGSPARASSIAAPFADPGCSERYFAAVAPITDAPRELKRISPSESRMTVVSGFAATGAPSIGAAAADVSPLGAATAAGLASAGAVLSRGGTVLAVAVAFGAGRCGGVGKSRGVSHRTRTIRSAAIAMRRVMEPARETGRAS